MKASERIEALEQEIRDLSEQRLAIQEQARAKTAERDKLLRLAEVERMAEQLGGGNEALTRQLAESLTQSIQANGIESAEKTGTPGGR